MLLGAAVLPAARAADPPPPCRSTATGDLRLHTLHSAIFGNDRTLRVLLPDGYDLPANAQRRYPVLYLLDGQNLFDACLSDVSHREWRVDETVRELVAAGRMPPTIVVGIDHAGKDRAHEYLPYKDFVGDPYMREPAGKSFPDFLATEVLPFVDARYRTAPGHANTGLGGSSYGGVATLYALLARPNLFGYGLIESPTLWVGLGQPVRDTAPLTAMPRRVYFGFGGREASDPAVNGRMVGLIRQVESNFRAAGYDDSSVRVTIGENDVHDEDAWARRLAPALEFLYGPSRAAAPGK
jgi:predicted alpha/beta superfamily hydrolase